MCQVWCCYIQGFQIYKASIPTFPVQLWQHQHHRAVRDYLCLETATDLTGMSPYSVAQTIASFPVYYSRPFCLVRLASRQSGTAGCHVTPCPHCPDIASTASRVMRHLYGNSISSHASRHVLSDCLTSCALDRRPDCRWRRGNQLSMCIYHSFPLLPSIRRLPGRNTVFALAYRTRWRPNERQ